MRIVAALLLLFVVSSWAINLQRIGLINPTTGSLHNNITRARASTRGYSYTPCQSYTCVNVGGSCAPYNSGSKLIYPSCTNSYCNYTNYVCVNYIPTGAKCAGVAGQCSPNDTCDGTSGKCRRHSSNQQLGDSCTNVFGCVSGLYCDSNSETCTAYPSTVGAECTNINQCGGGLNCVPNNADNRFTCQHLGLVPVGRKCYDTTDCQPGLFCSHAASTPVCKPSFASSRQYCSTSCTNPDEYCQCVDDYPQCSAPETYTAVELQLFSDTSACIDAHQCSDLPSCTACQSLYCELANFLGITSFPSCIDPTAGMCAISNANCPASYACAAVGSTCGFSGSGTSTVQTGCNNGYCSLSSPNSLLGTCFAYRAIGANCTDDEQCQPPAYCSTTTSKCTKYSYTQKLGDPCTYPFYCAGGLFCNYTSGICQNQSDLPNYAGASCTHTQDCLGTLDCVNFNDGTLASACVAIGSVPEGKTCSEDLDCQTGLFCDSNNGRICRKPYASSLKPCKHDSDCPASYEYCACQNGTQKCVASPGSTTALASVYSTFYTCMIQNNCGENYLCPACLPAYCNLIFSATNLPSCAIPGIGPLCPSH